MAPAIAMTVHDLEPGRTYTVVADLTHHMGTVRAGQRLTFRSRAFLPYHGGHTVVFDEVTLYLEDGVHTQVLQHLGDYLQPA